MSEQLNHNKTENERDDFDLTFSKKLSEYPVPNNLRDKIIQSVEQGNPKELHTNKIYTFPHKLKIAAIFIMLLSISFFLIENASKPNNGFQETLISSAVEYTENINQLHMNPNIQELKTFLIANQSSVPQKLPPNLSQLTTIGCRTVGLHGEKLSLICFRANKVYHLFVSNHDNMNTQIAQIPEPIYHYFGDKSSATWTENNQLFILVVKGNQADLKNILDVPTPINT